MGRHQRRLAATARHLSSASSRAPAAAPSPARSVGIALMGYGAIGVPVAQALLHGTHGMADAACPCHLAAVLVSTPRPRPAELPPSVVWTTDADEFFAADWQLCAEAAGQPAVVEHAGRLVELGRDLLVTSVGALTSDALYDSLIRSVSAPSGGRLLVAAGAMPAVDWMASASLGVAPEELDVTFVQTKPPNSWIGARYSSASRLLLLLLPAAAANPDLHAGSGDPEPDVIDFGSLDEPATFFEGSAREAATQYPKNSNIAAMLALATAGLDATKVKLVAGGFTSCACSFYGFFRQMLVIADPTPPIRNLARVSFCGPVGKLDVEVEGAQSANPRTGAVVPLTVLKAIKNSIGGLVLGA